MTQTPNTPEANMDTNTNRPADWAICFVDNAWHGYGPNGAHLLAWLKKDLLDKIAAYTKRPF